MLSMQAGRMLPIWKTGDRLLPNMKSAWRIFNRALRHKKRK
ncbi:MAG TPA: hypothetical protein VHN12_13660 [Geobacteraceae bacterium]|nr:hypothetical protein [Geobacteraceae bacterium]